MKTFKCDFGKGVSCTMEVADTLPADKSGHIQKVTWVGKPGPWTTRPYVAWINGVNTQLSSEWNVALMHVMQTGQFQWEAWAYWPGKPPKLALKSSGTLDTAVLKAAADRAAKKLGIAINVFDHITVERSAS